MPWAQFDEDGNYHETLYAKVRCTVHDAVMCGGVGAAAIGTMWIRDMNPDRAHLATVPDRCGEDRDDFGHTCQEWRETDDRIRATIAARDT